jgi:hypothetical protein
MQLLLLLEYLVPPHGVPSIITTPHKQRLQHCVRITYGELAFVALSMKDYENLALNIADIKRYIAQQNEIILYYEKAVTEEPKEQK